MSDETTKKETLKLQLSIHHNKGKKPEDKELTLLTVGGYAIAVEHSHLADLKDFAQLAIDTRNNEAIKEASFFLDLEEHESWQDAKKRLEGTEDGPAYEDRSS